MPEFCIYPRQPPAWAYTWECECGEEYQKIYSRLGLCENLPTYGHDRPIVMRKYTWTSTPVLAFPARLDHLVAAAFATAEALSSQPQSGAATLGNTLSDSALKELLKPHLESVYKDEGRVWVDPLDGYEDSGDSADEYDFGHPKNDDDWDELDDEEQETRKTDRRKVTEYDPFGKYARDDDYEPIDDSGPVAEKLARGQNDIHNFREIHDAFHAAQLSANDMWLLARYDGFRKYEDTFHEQNCRARIIQDGDKRPSTKHPHANGTRRQWAFDNTPNESEDLENRRGCRSFDRDYWDQLTDLYSRAGKRDFKKKWAARVKELRRWREMIGLDGSSPWIQENVTDVLQAAFPGIYITIVNPRVIENDEQIGDVEEVDLRIHNEDPAVCSFFPMAWVHVKTKWKSKVNQTLRGRRIPVEVEDDDGNEVENQDEGVEGDGEGDETDEQREIRYKQGYQPTTPGDPYHWYSNAARDPSEDTSSDVEAAERQRLMQFIGAFDLRKWVHPFQYLHSDYDGYLAKGSTKNPDNYVEEFVTELTDQGQAKHWPAVVTLWKTTDEDLEADEDSDEQPDTTAGKSGSGGGRRKRETTPKRKRSPPKKDKDGGASAASSPPAKILRVTRSSARLAKQMATRNCKSYDK